MTSINYNDKLPRSFYTRNVLEVAPQLLGKIFCRRMGKKLLAGKIVEVEAYDGSTDQAAHTYIGKTQRNRVMFEDGGLLYVYFTYGMYFCCNVVAGMKGQGQAILLRGIEPVASIEVMSKNRFGTDNISEKQKQNLSNGPGKICLAFAIKRSHNGIDLTGNEIYICNAPAVRKKFIKTTQRIGIKKSADFPWRFFIRDNPFVSRHIFNKS